MRESAGVEARLKDIERRTRRKFSSEEKIRIVLEGIRGETSITDLCRREGIHANQYYTCVCRQILLDSSCQKLSDGLR
jgi:transposase